jgi:mono/diheme cytochrome c family protein
VVPGAPDPSAVAFFEGEVRPILVERCQSCHGARKSKADLRLDSRAAILAGGESGPAIVPGDPKESLLVDAINYGELHQMPPKSKLSDREIATLTRWVEMGAPWASANERGKPEDAAKGGGFDLEERARHWSFQPLRASGLPEVKDKGWPRTPIDRFVLSALEARRLSPAPEADRRALIRRVTFDLTGLPPTPGEIAAFLADRSPAAYENVVERLLASPHHGERWGRHWLDLVGFAETAGHEFDYDIPDAYRYRDYVIRAFNDDLPYDQFVVEQVAGDLLDPPRRRPVAGFNESILGTAFFRLGEGTHSPVDLLDDEAIRHDHQIDVLSKTFLGLTVACARCHDHKFDPIATKDYYALSGYLQSSRHQHAFIDPPARIAARADELRALKESLRSLIEASGSAHGGPAGDWATSADASAPDDSLLFEDFDAPAYEGWSVVGDAFGTGPTRPGDWLIRREGTSWHAADVAPGVAHSGLVADRLQGVLRSRTFVIEKRYIHTLAAGKDGRINVVIDGFEKIRSPIYGGLTTAVNSDRPAWHTQDVGMWIGHRAYLEIADGATVNFTKGQSTIDPGDGFIAVDEIRFSDGKPARRIARPITRDVADLGGCAHPCGRHPWDDTLIRYAAIASKIPAPTLAPAIADGTGEDERVHIRGSSKNLGDVVPRRFLEVLAGADQPSPSLGSGRLELARRMVDPSHPLLARVLVNRVWKHHFGEGIVRTPDDFGKMGRAPSHPELLDDLAARFVAGGWSIKALHRLLVLSSTYRMRSEAIAGSEAERLDPTNEWLHRMNVRRLEAEAIRDALLAVSGRLDRAEFGPSVAPYLTPFMDGRGRPQASGPLDGNGRRSLYLNVRRNFLNPMFLAFDFPAPASPMGRRNVSNVPAQALTLMNDPFVVGQARLWAARLPGEGGATPRDRLAWLYETAFGRPPTDRETAGGLGFLAEQGGAYGGADDARAWEDLCHVLVNVKEFIYIK